MRQYIKHVVPATCLMLLVACSHTPVSRQTPATPVTEVSTTETIGGPVASAPDINTIDPNILQQYQQALTLMAAEKFDAAEKDFIRIMTAHSGLSGPYVNLGMIYMQTGRTGEAERAFEQAIERNPANVIAYNQLGILHRKAGRFDLALQFYKKALEIDPVYANAHLNLGILYDLYLNQPEKALNEYKSYQQLSVTEDKQVELWIQDISIRINQTPEPSDSGQP